MNNKKMSSRTFVLREINALPPISRIKTLRDDEGRGGFTLKCHAESSLLSISTAEKTQGRDPEQKPFGMALCKGFTLIELLVVVLIIGILAAIAVPQYQKAVLKSRFSSLMPLGKALAQGNETYYLEHGSYATDKNALDVTANDTKAQVSLGKESEHKYVLLTREDIKNNLRIYQKRSENFAGETHCEALLDNAQANWLCKDALKGTFIGNKYGYAVYSLDENTVGTLARVFYNGTGPFTDGDVCVGSRNWTGCADRKFSNGAVCIAKSARACNGSIFDHAYCTGSGGSQNSACGGYGGSYATYTNHSVCYAIYPTTCDGGRYDETSCCEGRYCHKEEDTCAYKGITPPPAPKYSSY